MVKAWFAAAGLAIAVLVLVALLFTSGQIVPCGGLVGTSDGGHARCGTPAPTTVQ